MDQITIRQRGEFEEGRGLWDVNYGDRTAECLGYDEVIGLVAAIMSRDGMPRGPMCLQWLKPRPQAWDPIAMGA